MADPELRLSLKAHKPCREVSDIHCLQGFHPGGDCHRHTTPLRRIRCAQHFRADFGCRLVYLRLSRADLRPAKRGWARTWGSRNEFDSTHFRAPSPRYPLVLADAS